MWDLSLIFVAARGIFSCDMQDLVPRPGIEPRPPALGARSLNHWITRKVLLERLLHHCLYHSVILR